MNFYYGSVFKTKFKKLVKSNPKLAKKISKTILEFGSKPNYPSLRLHKLTGKKFNQWSLSVSKSLRITFVYKEDGILITNFGKHEEVY